MSYEESPAPFSPAELTLRNIMLGIAFVPLLAFWACLYALILAWEHWAGKVLVLAWGVMIALGALHSVGLAPAAPGFIPLAIGLAFIRTVYRMIIPKPPRLPKISPFSTGPVKH